MSLNNGYKLGIHKRETNKIILVQVHHEELIRRGQIRFLFGESVIKVANILAMFLEFKFNNYSRHKIAISLRTYNLWHNGRFHFAGLGQFPIN